MATGTGKYYGKMFVALLNKEINILSDDIKITLHTASYAVDQDTHDYADDLTNEVANGNGYTTGGQSLANDTVTYTGGTNTIKYDADDVSWPSSTFTARYAVIKDNTPSTAATKPLLFYIDFGADLSPNAGTFQITFDTAGVATIVVS